MSTASPVPSAAYAVLTQAPLLALVTSFQPGLPGATRPLILRYLHATLRTTHDDDDSATSSDTLSDTLLNDLWTRPSACAGALTWRVRLSDDALETFGRTNQDHVDGWTRARVSRKTLPSVDRVRAAANNYGRRDVLAWHSDAQATALTSFPILRRFPTPPRHSPVSRDRVWRERVTAEAIATFDNATLDVLRVLMRAYEAQELHRLRRRITHRVWEAAAAVGRVDMLVWLYATQPAILSSATTSLGRHAAAVAVRHGQLAVLSWLETTFGAETVYDGTWDFNLKATARQQRVDVVTWMAQRTFGHVSLGAAHVAIARRDVALLRALLHFPSSSSPSQPDRKRTMQDEFGPVHGYALAKFAMDVTALSQWDVLLPLIQLLCTYPIDLLHHAITQHHDAAIQYLLANLRHASLNFERGGRPATWIVHSVLREQNERVLDMVTSVTDTYALRHTLGVSVLLWEMEPSLSDNAVRMLLRVSPTGDIACLLLRSALDGNASRVATILTLVESQQRVLPTTATALVERVQSETLGPLASLARGYRDDSASDEHVVETMTHGVTSASPDDVRDAVLCLLFHKSVAMTQRVLEIDAGGRRCCDDGFVRFCLSLETRPFLWNFIGHMATVFGRGRVRALSTQAER